MIREFASKTKVRALDEGAGDNWFHDMTKEQQELYVEQHPNSKYAKQIKQAEQEKEGKADAPAKDDAPKNVKPVQNYNPDVEEKGEDGVTKAARVGLKGDEVPPPPGIPRLPNLSETEKAVEEAFASDFEKQPEQMTNDFYEMVLSGKKPPTFGTDDAKMLTSDWMGEEGEERSARRATLNVALHQTANAVAKRAFLKHLDTLKEGDSVMVTVGGCGAGKGYSLENVPDAMNAASKSQAVWDSAGDQNATENPWIQKEADKRGLKVTYVFVNADPEVSWADPKRGVVKRANNPKDGRMVDAYVFADSYAIGAKNHAAFAEANKDNPNANFLYIDSAGKPPTLVDKMPESALQFDRKKLAAFALDALDKADAPEHVKQGGSVGKRIWGPVKESSMAVKQAPIKTQAASSKEKYSWEQYLKDEQDRLDKLAQSPHAGKYGGGYKGKDVPKKVVETEEQKSFAFLKKIGVKPDAVPDKEVRKRYESFLKKGS